MEIVCTDCRIPEYAMHHQRIEWMNNLAVEDYTKMAFEKMKKSIPMMVAFIVIMIHLIISGYLFFGGTLDLSFLSFLGKIGRAHV